MGGVATVEAVLGDKGGAGGLEGEGRKAGGQTREAVETGGLELSSGRRNAVCSGEMLRDRAEPRWRWKRTDSAVTLRNESVGSEKE